MKISLGVVTNLLLGLSAILGAQRYIFPMVSAHVCVLPLLCGLLGRKFPAVTRNTFILIALFLTVDNGGGTYFETEAWLRYVIYVAVIWDIVSGTVISKKKLVVFFLVLIYPILLTLLYYNSIDIVTLIRDLEFTFLLIFMLCRSSKSGHILLDEASLLKFFSCYIAAELINIILFFNIIDYGYLNYSSVKSFIVFPSLYFLAHSRFFPAAALVLATFVILVAYGTRMILLTYLLSLAIFILFKIRLDKTFYATIIGLFILFSIVIVWFKQEPNLMQYKAIAYLVKIDLNESVAETIRSFDPVRYEETKLFFDRGFFEILFGDGFGSGIEAKSGEFDFVRYGSSAFTDQELDSNFYYNLHDTWIDLGLRFGLLFIVAFYGYFVSKVGSAKPLDSVYGMLLIVLFSCASFSAAGLILIAYFFLLISRSHKTNAPYWYSGSVLQG